MGKLTLVIQEVLSDVHATEQVKKKQVKVKKKTLSVVLFEHGMSLCNFGYVKTSLCNFSSNNTYIDECVYTEVIVFVTLSMSL